MPQVGFDEARKVQETPFPFPNTQLCNVLLHFYYSLLMPCMMAAYIPQWQACCTVTFIALRCLFGINVTATHLESPFDKQANDLPLDYYFCEFAQDIEGLLSDEAVMSATTCLPASR